MNDINDVQSVPPKMISTLADHFLKKKPLLISVTYRNKLVILKTRLTHSSDRQPEIVISKFKE